MKRITAKAYVAREEAPGECWSVTTNLKWEREKCGRCSGGGGLFDSRGYRSNRSTHIDNWEHPDYWWSECSHCDGSGYEEPRFNLCRRKVTRRIPRTFVVSKYNWDA